MPSMNPLLICVVGPTAIGKTALAISIAEALGTEILSADSRQLFKEMTIGTAVPSAEELSQVPHHCIQNKTIFEPYTVGDYEQEALEIVDGLFASYSEVVLVGGSGLYVNALVYGLDDFPEIPSEIREQLNDQLSTEGIESLQKELAQVDPDYFDKADIQNPHRVIRALEVFRSSGKPFSSFLKGKQAKRNFDTLFIGLTADRDVVYDRINRRVDSMVENGLVEEARALYDHKDLNALQTVGYRELFQYFEGQLTLEEAISEIKKNTRRFAKRQGTWFRKSKNIHWFDWETPHAEIISFIKKKNAR